MAKINGYALRQEREKDGFWKAGVECGFQEAADMIFIALNDAEVMGRDTLGPERLRKVYDAALGNQDRYGAAFRKGDEQDVAQERLDDRLRKACGPYFEPFGARYPKLKEIKYGK